MTLSRRTFLLGTGGLITVGFATERTMDWARRRPVLNWITNVSGTPGVQDLGTEYLTRNPDEASREALLSRLASLVGRSAVLKSSLRAADDFNEQVRRDFREGETLWMGGWLLSRTELRLCALAAVHAAERTGTAGVFSPQRLAGDVFYWTAPTARFTLPARPALLEFQYPVWRRPGPAHRGTHRRQNPRRTVVVGTQVAARAISDKADPK